MNTHWRRAIFAGLLFALVSVLYIQTAVADGHGGNGRRGNFRLTVLHNNDGESQLIDAGAGLEDFGGIARFATVVDDLRDEARSRRGRHGRSGVVTLSSGDNFLAGPEWNASLENGFPYYDSIGLALIGYDAITFGNHEFDFNPDVTAEFIKGFEPFDRTPFISANLKFRNEPELRRLQWRGRIAKSVIVNERGEKIGIIGATTENLPFISTPRGSA